MRLVGGVHPRTAKQSIRMAECMTFSKNHIGNSFSLTSWMMRIAKFWPLAGWFFLIRSMSCDNYNSTVEYKIYRLVIWLLFFK